MSNSTPTSEVRKIQSILKEDLYIPFYQRPYRWEEKHVFQLLDDIDYFRKHNRDVAYRIGTIVLHKNNDRMDIVDGQQRLVTLNTIAFLIDQKKDEYKWIRYESDQNFEKSKKAIYDNYKLIEQWIEDTKKRGEFEDFKDFLLNKCEVVVITLTKLSEAFQFFDSQNSRGKDLYPHDLLKAYHLRRMHNDPDDKQLEVDRLWQEMGEERLKKLFGRYLYHIKSWSQNKDVHKHPFTKDKIDYFKGIDPEAPYHQLSKTAQNLCLSYAAYEILDKLPSFLDNMIQKPSSIYQIDAPIMEGYHFFKMVEYYDKLLSEWVVEYAKIQGKSETEFKRRDFIPKWLKEGYDGAGRTGDRAVRNLFNNALVYYIDKFGEKNLHQAVRYLVNYSYSLRFLNSRMNLGKVDKERKKWFVTLRFAIDDRDLPIAKNGWEIENFKKSIEELQNTNKGLLVKIFGNEKSIDIESIEKAGLYDVSFK